METKFIEATNRDNGMGNWGKFLLGRFTAEEWSRSLTAPRIPALPLLRVVGWAPNHLMVFDLQTGEGGIFMPGGSARADLEKHALWVCPLFEPFLTWLYTQDVASLDALPGHVLLPESEFAFAGYRRLGPLKGAIKPFLAIADRLRKETPDTTSLWAYGDEKTELTAGDFRNLRSVAEDL